MSRVSVSIQNFASGEVTPKLRGRFDISLFSNGSERMVNFISETQGPARYRPGFRFVAKTRHNLPARLISFIYNDADSYVMEFTVGGIRFFVNEGLLLEASTTITGITQADPGVITITSHGYSDGDEVVLSGIVGMTELNNLTVRVNNSTANTFEIQTVEGVDIDTSGFAAYSSGGVSKRIFTLDNPYTTIAEIDELEYAQAGDLMYFTHKSFEPRKLTRSGALSWTFATYTRTADPFGTANNYPSAVNIYSQRLYMGGTNNDPLKIWGSKAANFDNFTAGTSAPDSFAFTIASNKINRITSMSSNNKFLACLSGGGNKSITGGGDSITPTNVKIDDIDFLGSAKTSPIVKDNLIIFIQQGRLKVRALEYSFDQDGYQPINLTKSADHITESGVKELTYQEGSPDIIWGVRADGELLGLTFEKQENITGWHRHKTGEDFNDKFYSTAAVPRDSDYEQLWAVTQREISGNTNYYVEFMEDIPVYPEFSDYFTGQLNNTSDYESFALAMYEKQKEAFYIDCGSTYDGSLQSVSITPGATTGTGVSFTASGSLFDSDDVGRRIWAKNVNGRAEITAYVSPTVVTCKILQDFESTSAIAAGDWYFTASSLSGLSHLEGRSVDIVTDGAIHPNRTVTNGSVNLDYQAGVIHIGLAYTGLIISNNIEGGGANGPSQTKVKNVFKLGIRFLNTLGTSFGTDLYNMEKILFRATNSFTSRPPPLFSGDRVFTVEDNFERQKKIIIRQDVPLPCNVQLYMVYLNTSED